MWQPIVDQNGDKKVNLQWKVGDLKVYGKMVTAPTIECGSFAWPKLLKNASIIGGNKWIVD